MFTAILPNNLKMGTAFPSGMTLSSSPTMTLPSTAFTFGNFGSAFPQTGFQQSGFQQLGNLGATNSFPRFGIPGAPQLFTRLAAFNGQPFGTTPVGGDTSYEQATTEIRAAQNLFAPDHPVRGLLGSLYDGMIFGLRNPPILQQAASVAARQQIFGAERPFANVDRFVNGIPDNTQLNQSLLGSPFIPESIFGFPFTPSQFLDQQGIVSPGNGNVFPLQAIGLFPVPPSTTTAPLFNNPFQQFGVI